MVYVVLRAQQACSQDLIDSVRTSLLNFLTNPNTAFGECLNNSNVAPAAPSTMSGIRWSSELPALNSTSHLLFPPPPSGVYSPTVSVTVACYDVPAGQVGAYDKFLSRAPCALHPCFRKGFNPFLNIA